MTWKEPIRWVIALTVGLVVCLSGQAMAESAEEPAAEQTATDEAQQRVHPVWTMQSLWMQAPCELEALPGGVGCRFEGRTTMVLLHPSLFLNPTDYRDGVDGDEPVGPVEFGGDYFYGIGQELLRFDREARAVGERRRMPAAIAEIEAAEEGLEVTVEPSVTAEQFAAQMGRPLHERRSVVIDYDPDGEELPGRAPWDWSGTLGALHDVMWLDGVPMEAEPGIGGAPEAERDEGVDRALVEMLEWRERRDGANPYLALYRGEALERIGDSEAADAAFAEAVAHDDADWIDLARIGLRMEYRGRTELADEAFDRSAGAMEDAGVRREYVTAMVNATFALVWLRDVMADAVTQGDLERVHRVASAVDELFPKLEGSPAAWARLGALFEEYGETSRAEHWKGRADEIRATERPDQLFEDTASSVDIFLVLQFGLFLTALFAGAILGLWRYQEDEPDEEGGDGDEESDLDAWREYLPRFQMGDLASVAALFVVLLLLPTLAVSSLQSMVTLADAPPEASGDAVAAPVVAQWTEGLAESDARDDLLEESLRELEAAKAGSRGPGELDLNRALVEAVEADTEARQIRSFGDIEVSEMAMQEFEWLRPLVEVEFDATGLVILFGVLALNALIFGALLQAVARRFPGVGRVGRTVVPGAPNALRWLRLTVLATFMVGLLLMTSLSQTVETSTEASLVALFGLEEAPSAVSTAAPTVGFILVVVALVVHAVGVVMDRRSVG